MRHIAAAVIVCTMLGACYSSAQSARQSQTLAAESWACLSDPVVSCPSQPGGTCTGWDQRWVATCPDDGSRWVCRFASEGARAGEARLSDDRVFCSRIEGGATASR